MFYEMNIEDALGKGSPKIYHAPDGKQIGIVTGITAGVGAVIGGGVWFLHSEQAAPLREKASHLLERISRRQTVERKWAAHLPEMLDDSEDPAEIARKLMAVLTSQLPVYQIPLLNPKTGLREPVEIQESSVDRVGLFSKPRDFQVELRRNPHAMPPLDISRSRVGLDETTHLIGLTIPEGARLSIKGEVDITYGSTQFIPAFGIHTRTFGIVPVDAQTLVQLDFDKQRIKEDQLALLLGKLIFFSTGIQRYRTEGVKTSRFANLLKLVPTQVESFGRWIEPAA